MLDREGFLPCPDAIDAFVGALHAACGVEGRAEALARLSGMRADAVASIGTMTAAQLDQTEMGCSTCAAPLPRRRRS